jgi:tRNA threonylcarbamoyladenosine biosynthesis protein TsaE
VIEARTKGPSETSELAAAVAGLARDGDLLVLVGDLGAGKTMFVKGFGSALGVSDTITSPTFTLAREYRGKYLIHHLDVYRIEQLEEVRDLALPELLDGGAVTLIEWGDTIAPMLPNDYLEVRLEFGEGDDDRLISLRCVGARWSARSGALCSVLEPWLEEPC